MHHPFSCPRSPRASVALVVAIALGCAASPGLAAPGFDPPPIAAAPTQEHHVGKVIWTELVTPDVAAAERFYGGLFGWTFEHLDRDGTRYALARVDGVRVAGIVQHAIRPHTQREPAWLGFIAVQDVDVTVRNAVDSGGRILRPAHTYAARGRQAILVDPQGAVFGVMASFSGDPPDALAPRGTWIWDSLLARDASVDAAFYQTLFGYDVFDLDSEDGQDHVILSTDGYARAGVNTLPADAARRHPRWLGFVRVADAQAAAARALELGGGVLVAPRIDRHGGLLAVLKDPSGAAFGVMEWSVQDAEELP